MHDNENSNFSPNSAKGHAAPLEGQAAPRTLANVISMLGSGQRAVSRQDAGRMLGVSWRTIERLVDRGELRAFKLLGQWRILVSDIDAYVAARISEQKMKIGA
ncbi:MAG: helix-turn-helix domain-containing protein [Planctomycetota bacterium]